MAFVRLVPKQNKQPSGNGPVHVRNHHRRPGCNVKEHTRSRPGTANMGWNQAKRRFPNLSPDGDADGDGVINKKDCKPLNKWEQDDWKEEARERLTKDIDYWENEREKKIRFLKSVGEPIDTDSEDRHIDFLKDQRDDMG